MAISQTNYVMPLKGKMNAHINDRDKKLNNETFSV